MPSDENLDRRERLMKLYEEIHSFAAERDLELHPRAVVDRSLDSEVLLVAQALGRDTQRLSGFPYVFPDRDELSKGGRTLDRFLAGFGYTIQPGDWGRRYAYHADLVPWFPGRKPGGAGDVEPTADEIATCWRWLQEEIELVAPSVIVALGRHAAREILSRHGGIAFTRSSPKLDELVRRAHACVFGEREIPVFVVHHPSGAFQHPASSDVYEWTAAEIGALLRR